MARYLKLGVQFLNKNKLTLAAPGIYMNERGVRFSESDLLDYRNDAYNADRRARYHAKRELKEIKEFLATPSGVPFRREVYPNAPRGPVSADYVRKHEPILNDLDERLGRTKSTTRNLAWATKERFHSFKSSARNYYRKDYYNERDKRYYDNYIKMLRGVGGPEAEAAIADIEKLGVAGFIQLYRIYGDFLDLRIVYPIKGGSPDIDLSLVLNALAKRLKGGSESEKILKEYYGDSEGGK